MKNPFERLGELYAEKIVVPLMSSQTFNDLAKNIVKTQRKIEEELGVRDYFENKREQDNLEESSIPYLEEFHPREAQKLKAKRALKNGLKKALKGQIFYDVIHKP